MTASNTWVRHLGIGRRQCERREPGETQPPGAEGAFGRRSKPVGLIGRRGGALLLAALGASGHGGAAAVAAPAATNRVLLTWASPGPGTEFYIQTSTNVPTWTAVTNTTATNVSLTFIGDNARMFRLSASNAPPQAATLFWDFGVPSAGVVGYAIYYGVSTGNYTNLISVGLGTNGVVSNLVAGATYYFATTAYTASGLESDFSEEAIWQCPLQLSIQRLP